MNGFESKGLDEDAFGEKSSLSGLKTFDAFRESLNNPIPGQSSYHGQIYVFILSWSPIHPKITV